MKGILAAVQFLTISRRFSRAVKEPAEVAAAIFYFPLIGLALGVTLAGVNYFLERYLESEILGTVDVIVLILLTGAAHLDQLRRRFDLLSVSSDAQGSASAIGIYGLLAVLLVVLLKIRAIEVIGETRSLSLIITPALARWAPLMLIYGAAPQSAAGRMAAQLKSWQFILITAATLAAAAYLQGVAGLWVGLGLSLLALGARFYFTSRTPGIDKEVVGMLIELGESLSFVLFASL